MPLRRLRPPRLRTVLLCSNLAVVALPVAGLWALRLYESALVRQTQSEQVAQAAILASAMRQAVHVTMPGRDGPVLPPEPDPDTSPAADPVALDAGRALVPVLQDAQTVTLASLRITDRYGTVVASSGVDAGRSLAGWSEIARTLAGEPIVSTLRRREAASAVPGGISRTSPLRVVVSLPITDAAGAVIGAVLASRTPPSVVETVLGKWRSLTTLFALLASTGIVLAALVSRLLTLPLAQVIAQAETLAGGRRNHKAAPSRHAGSGSALGRAGPHGTDAGR